MFVFVQDAAEPVTGLNRAPVRAELTLLQRALTAQHENVRVVARSLIGR